MNWLKRACVLIAGSALTLPLAVGDELHEVAPDEPVREEKDLFLPPVRLAAADGVIDSGAAWGHSGPWVEDVDDDRIQDLVVGDFSGLFKFYRNLGTSEQPRYAQAVNLQAGGADAKVPIY